MLNLIMLSVVMLSVQAPYFGTSNHVPYFPVTLGFLVSGS